MEENMGIITIYWQFRPAASLFEQKSYTPNPCWSGFGTICTPLPIMVGEAWRGEAGR